MSKVPSCSHKAAIAALRRCGFEVVRQRGSHIRMEKRTADTTIKITVPAHNPIKRSTLSHILKDAGVTVEEFLDKL